MDVIEVGQDDADWIHLAQDSYTWWNLVNTAVDIRLQYTVWNSFSS
jgi:hypothetical protein